MADIVPPSSPLANYSEERRLAALSWIRGEGLLASAISYDARLAAAVGLLICDDAGHIKKADLHAAMADPSIVQAARQLLREARECR